MGTVISFIVVILLRFMYTVTRIRYISLQTVVDLLLHNFVGQVQLISFLLFTALRSRCPPHTMEDVCPNGNITYLLYNKNLKQPYQLKVDNEESLREAPFIIEVPLKILMHGYGGHRDDGPNPQIRPHYVQIGYNVITIDYHPVVRKPCYIQAVSNVNIIARCISEFIATLLEVIKLNTQWLHIIGFSLGTHIAVTTGRMLTFKGIVVPRITDAAAPMFYIGSHFTNPPCATFVDAVHTNVGFYGKSAKIAHVDFYVNFLFFQEGCSITDVSCNHAKAPEYYAESITTSTGFWGYPLETQKNIEIMGEYTPTCARGSYYLTTNEEAPYATGTAFSNMLIVLRDQAWNRILDIYKLSSRILMLVGHLRFFSTIIPFLKKSLDSLLEFMKRFINIHTD